MAVLAIPVFFSFFGSYLRHLRVAASCHSYSLCARRCRSVSGFVAGLRCVIGLVSGPLGTPLDLPQNVVFGASDGSGRFVSVKGDSLLAPNQGLFWSASRRSTWGLADLPALVTDPDTWQELSQDSLLASSGSFRPWASGFLSLSWPITLSCATGATATMLTYWLWRQDQTLGRNSCLHSCTTILHGHSPRRCTRLSLPLLGPPPLAFSFRRSTSSSLWRKSVSQWRGTGP